MGRLAGYLGGRSTGWGMLAGRLSGEFVMDRLAGFFLGGRYAGLGCWLVGCRMGGLWLDWLVIWVGVTQGGGVGL